uniref:Uncharacterized protein n=1 Tax=Rhizophora mucronata TaxID=61149 RepID=A0A2P2NH15_RHIMU
MCSYLKSMHQLAGGMMLAWLGS